MYRCICVNYQQLSLQICYISTTVQKQVKLKNAYEDLIDISHQWYDLGLQLELEGTLENIKSDNPENSQHCLREMLSTWLKLG